MVEVASRLTVEQGAIADSNVDCKVQAYAGSGKSTSLLEYIKRHPHKRVLYLCFNKPNRIEFQKKVTENNFTNASVNTAHSIAKHYLYGQNKVHIISNHSPYYLLQLFKPVLNSIPVHEHLLTIHHAQKLIQTFCASRESKVQKFNYIHFTSPDHHDFIEKHLDFIIEIAIGIMQRMSSHEIGVLHDYYLKLFQLKRIQLPFDTFLFDEVQDCSPVMLDIVQNQKGVKIFVGDQHQEIYAWRGAINAFQFLNLPEYQLSTSFRFGKSVAKVASAVLNTKQILISDKLDPIEIHGVGPNLSVRGTAYISRSVVGLLKDAFLFVRNHPKEKIRFQNGLSGYMRHEQGFTLTDVYHLYIGEENKVKNDFLLMFSFEELAEFAAQTDDYVLQGFIKLVEGYGRQLPFFVSALFKAEIPPGASGDSSVTFSTVHRIKGLEFNEVVLSDDFHSKGQLLQMKANGTTQQQINEEINLLYVALSRASQSIVLDEAYL